MLDSGKCYEKTIRAGQGGVGVWELHNSVRQSEQTSQEGKLEGNTERGNSQPSNFVEEEQSRQRPLDKTTKRVFQ